MLPIVADQIPNVPVTRFAPSITGWLHLGHVAHAVFVWGVARALGARIVLRLEDHDRGRFRPEYETAILADLEWLGLHPDDEQTSLCRQSERGDLYTAELEGLAVRHHVYACDCTRATMRDAVPEGKAVAGAYSGRCRNRNLSRAPGRGVRVLVEPGVEGFADLMLGERQLDAAEKGDPLLLDRAEAWTYHFAVVVDDYRQGVNLVIRGEDLLPSTALQIRLARMLGRETPPVFMHHPLVRDEFGNKLSKRDGALAVKEMRAAGMTPEAMLGLAAHRVGLQPTVNPLPASDLSKLFG